MTAFRRTIAAALIAFGLAAAAPPVHADEAVATFAGGCFWCMEPPYDKLDGVLATTSGFMGGDIEDPTYDQVTAGGTGHAEVVQVTYDPEQVSYGRLLAVYWRNIDPFAAGGQFCDRGDSYRAEIFVHDAEQRRLAEASRTELQARFEQEIVVPITEAGELYPAEDHHQNYYRENPIRYRVYRSLSGRDGRLEQIWIEGKALDPAFLCGGRSAVSFPRQLRRAAPEMLRSQPSQARERLRYYQPVALPRVRLQAYQALAAIRCDRQPLPHRRATGEVLGARLPDYSPHRWAAPVSRLAESPAVLVPGTARSGVAAGTCTDLVAPGGKRCLCRVRATVAAPSPSDPRPAEGGSHELAGMR